MNRLENAIEQLQALKPHVGGAEIENAIDTAIEALNVFDLLTVFARTLGAFNEPMPPAPLPDPPHYLADVGLSVRSFNALWRAGYETLEEIAAKMDGPSKMTCIRNFGNRSQEELIQKVHEYGLRFAWEYTKEEREAAFRKNLLQNEGRSKSGFERKVRKT